MADATLNVNIKANGTTAAQRALANVERAAEQLKIAIQPNAGASSAWNPYIAALKKIEEAQKAAAETARKQQEALQPNAGAASAWNPFISAQRQAAMAAEKQAEAARKQAAANQAAVSAGAASKWSPQIGAVKQLEAAQNAAADAARKLADANAKAQSAGLASAWSPQISQARAMNQAAADAALGRAAAYVPAGGRLATLNQSMVDAQAAAQDRYGALTGAATTYGRGALLVGGAGTYALGRAAVDAGRLEQTRRSIESYDGGKELYQKLLQFDKSSPMNLQEVLAQGQSALAQDFKASEIVPMFNTLGDAVVKAGGGTQEFASAMVQIAQIKNKGVASMQDIKAMAEGAKLPIIPILREALGAERVKGILSGEDPIGAEELFKHVFEGLKKRSGGAMQEYMNTLPGALGELESNFYMMRTEIGEHLVPILKLGTSLLNGVVNIFRALPDPLKSIVSVGGGLLVGLTALGGGLLTLAGPALNLVQTISLLRTAQATTTASTTALTVAETATGVAARGAAASLMGTLVPVLTVALPLAIAAGAALMLKAAADAQMESHGYREDRQTRDNLPSADTASGAAAQAAEMDRMADEAAKDIEEHKRQRKISWPINIFTGMTPAQYDQEIANMEEERQGYLKRAAQLRAKAKTLPASVVSSAQGQAQAMPGVPTVAGGMSFGGAATSFGDAGMVDSLESEIESLQRESRTADKERKKVIADMLFEKRIALKHAKESASKLKRENKASEKDQKAALQASIEESRSNLDLKGVETEERYNTRIAQLEAERDAAAQDKNEAQEAQLRFEIDKLQAERDYALAKINADATGLEDEKRRDALLRIAEAKKRGALERAQIAYNSARTKVVGGIRNGVNGVLAGLPPGLQTRGMALAAEGPMFNPYANARYEGEEAFTRVIGRGGNYPASIARASRDNRIAKVKHRLSRAADGKIKIEFETVEIDDLVQEMGNRL